MVMTVAPILKGRCKKMRASTMHKTLRFVLHFLYDGYYLRMLVLYGSYKIIEID